MEKKTFIRLGTTGKADVTRAFDEIAETGDASAKRLAKSYERAANDTTRAFEIAAEKQRKEAGLAAKLDILRPGLNPTKLDSYAGVQGASGKSAEASASVFQADYARMEARARALVAAMDPAIAAQDRFNREIAEARTLVGAGLLTLDQYCDKLRIETATLNAASVAGGRHAASSRQHGQSTMMLGQQIQDFAVQVSSGQSIVTAFSQQIGQSAFALQGMGGKLAGVASFLASGWGAALLVALTVLGPLVAKLWESGKASEEAAKAAKEHESAIEALIEAQRRAVQTGEEKARADYVALEAERQKAVRIRETTAALLAQAKAQYEIARGTNFGAGGGAGAGMAQAMYAGRVSDLEAQIAANAAKLVALTGAAATAATQYIRTIVDSNASAEGRLKRKYDQLGSEARQEAERTKDWPKYAQTIANLNAAREAEEKALRDATKSLTRRDGETLTASNVAKMLRGELPGVQITSTTGGQHVPGSYHYKNQAVDFVPQGGMSAMTKADVRALFESRGIEIVELLGPGDAGHSDHFHVAWTKGKLALDGFVDAAKRAKDTQADLESLMASTGEFLRGFDVSELRAQSDARFNDAARTILGLSGDPLAEGVEEYERTVKAELAIYAAAMAKQKALWDEFRTTGSNAIDTLFDLRSADSWGDRVKAVIGDIQAELVKLALINPLKNALFGQENPTFGGANIFGSIGKLFGGSGGGAWNGSGGILPGDLSIPNSYDPVFNAPAVPGFAIGTQYTSGGAMLVGENGPEIVSSPRGSRVASAGDTRRMLATNDNLPTIHMPVTISAPGADAAALGRVQQELAQLRAELPARAVAAFQDARSRRMIR